MRSSTPSGMRVIASIDDDRLLGEAHPTIAVPMTRSPTARSSIDAVGRADLLDHAGELAPGHERVGTVIWYSSATTSTSGKFTDAARTRTRT